MLSVHSSLVVFIVYEDSTFLELVLVFLGIVQLLVKRNEPISINDSNTLTILDMVVSIKLV